MIKFITGKTYYCRSICDHECIFKFEITRRTTKTIWAKDLGNKKILKRRIAIWYDDTKESFMPYGAYSMAPIVTAARMGNPT